MQALQRPESPIQQGFWPFFLPSIGAFNPACRPGKLRAVEWGAYRPESERLTCTRPPALAKACKDDELHIVPTIMADDGGSVWAVRMDGRDH